MLFCLVIGVAGDVVGRYGRLISFWSLVDMLVELTVRDSAEVHS